MTNRKQIPSPNIIVKRASTLIVLDAFVPVFQSTKRYINMRGGRGSSKSHHAALKSIKWLLSDDFERIFCARKYYNKVERSQYKMIKDIINQNDLHSKIGIGKSPLMFWNKMNGNEIIFSGADDPELLKSVTNITKSWCEETTEFEPEDISTISLSVRGPQIKNYPQILLTYNSISETHWLKPKFWDNPPKNSFNHTSTYLDNPFLDESYIEELELLKETDPDLYRIVALNEWGVIRTGREFAHNFKYSEHVVDEDVHDINRSVVLIFDNNLLPYSTCLLRQLIRRDDNVMDLVYFDEICLEPPYNTIEDIRDEIFRRHPWIKSVFYSGDPQGRAKGQRKTRDEADSYEAAVVNAFAKWSHNQSNIWLNSHPPLASRKNGVAVILQGKRCRLTIHKRCKNLIKDFETLQMKDDGGYVKKTIKDKTTGATYEAGAHCMDAFVYDCATIFPDLFFPR